MSYKVDWDGPGKLGYVSDKEAARMGNQLIIDTIHHTVMAHFKRNDLNDKKHTINMANSFLFLFK